MNNTMMTIANYISTHLASFCLTSQSQLALIEKTTRRLEDGGRRLIVLPLRTTGDTSRKATFGNLLDNGQKGERFLTTLEMECKTRAPKGPDGSQLDFYWNAARAFRDQVYEALAGPSRNGLTIPRLNWADHEHPVPAGQVWFEVNSGTSPIEDEVEDPSDPANKSVFLTYQIHWWRPIG